jgi:hypothetical protein
MTPIIMGATDKTLHRPATRLAVHWLPTGFGKQQRGACV